MSNLQSRVCKCCNQQKELNLEYYPSAGIIKGVQYYRLLCIKCYSKQKKKERYTLKDQFDAYKKTLNCNHCGNTDHRVMEFHHVDASTKERNISDLLSRKNSWENIMQEMKKCICLCANCHRIEHYVER